MSKLLMVIQCVLASCGFAILGAAAWQMAGAYVEVPAPITPALWFASAFLWFMSISYAGAAISAPFRRAH